MTNHTSREIDPHAPYTVYKADMSYFTGKLEAYMRYKSVPHDAVDADMSRE